MRPFRNLKIESLIEQELSRILAREFHVDGSLVTISSVSVSKDLAKAEVKLSIIPYDKELEVYDEILNQSRHIEHVLLRKMNIRPMPKLEFLINSSEEKLRIKKKGQVAKW